jgi:hypothetical protein
MPRLPRIQINWRRADDALGLFAAFLGQMDHLVVVHRDQMVANHPLQRGSDGRRRDTNALGQPSTDNSRAIAGHVVHDLEVVFNRFARLAIHALGLRSEPVAFSGAPGSRLAATVNSSPRSPLL